MGKEKNNKKVEKFRLFEKIAKATTVEEVLHLHRFTSEGDEAEKAIVRKLSNLLKD